LPSEITDYFDAKKNHIKSRCDFKHYKIKQSRLIVPAGIVSLFLQEPRRKTAHASNGFFCHMRILASILRPAKECPFVNEHTVLRSEKWR